MSVMKKCPYCGKEITPKVMEERCIQYDDKGRLCHSECWNKEVDKRDENAR